MNCAVVVNPAAANGRVSRRWPELSRRLEAQGFSGATLFTDAPGSATELTRRALHAGVETIVAVGGDGTVNEVVNGFFVAGRPVNPAARLGIVCCGTGADFVRCIGLPPGEPAIPHLAGGRTVALDVGQATFHTLAGAPATRYFLNFADLGMGGETVARVNRTTKVFGGFVSFMWGAVQAILAYRCKQVEIALDGGPPLRQAIGDIVVANGRYFGGGMRVAPEASVVDGCFDVFVLGEVSKPRLLFDLLPRVYRGTHVGHPKVWWRRARRLAVRADERLLLDIDGELAGASDAQFDLLPRALPVIVPRRFQP